MTIRCEAQSLLRTFAFFLYIPSVLQKTPHYALYLIQPLPTPLRQLCQNVLESSQLPPSPSRFRQFWRAVIWAIVFLIVLIFIHTVAFALWRARAKTFAPGVLFFPRFELFLVAVTVAGIANSSAFIIAGDSAWGLGLGLAFLVLWPVLFVGWMLLFLLIKVVRVSQVERLSPLFLLHYQGCMGTPRALETGCTEKPLFHDMGDRRCACFVLLRRLRWGLDLQHARPSHACSLPRPCSALLSSLLLQRGQ
jgi:hypothetical protein